MKKMLLFLFLFSNIMFADTIESFIDYNFSKNYKFQNGKKLEKRAPDFALNFEFYNPPIKNSISGFGIGQSEVTIKNYSKNKINITPFYLTQKYVLTGANSVGTFFKIQGGVYSTSSIFGKTEISNPDEIQLKSGLYYGVGLGIEFKKIILQASYKNFLGDSLINGIKTKLDYHTTTISLGYSIEI